MGPWDPSTPGTSPARRSLALPQRARGTRSLAGALSLCPPRSALFCDYYNPHGECEWHYQACGAPCLKTCRNPSGRCLMDLPGQEGEKPAVPGNPHLLTRGRHTDTRAVGSRHLHTTPRDKEAQVGSRPRQH